MNNEIINNLFNEFESEKNELKIKYDDNASRIEVINENIKELIQYDDDRQMFSPRTIAGNNSEKIEELKSEKESLIEENSFISSRLKYFESKVDALEEVLQESDTGSEPDNKEDTDDKSRREENINTEKKIPENDDAAKEELKTDNISNTEKSDDNNIKSEQNLNIGKSKLKKIIYRLELAYKLMDTNIVRSKNELKSVISILSKESD